MTIAPAARPMLMDKYPPRCPHLPEVTSVEDLLPYIREVAKRPYSQGLHAAWDLHPGERILLKWDNWHDPMCLEATKRVIAEFGCTLDVQFTDRGPQPVMEGHNEIEFFIDVTNNTIADMEAWRRIEDSGKYDKLLWGFGGPVLSEAKIKIQRMHFITPEMCANEAMRYPYEILEALDRWTWDKIAHARRVHITDPEGTDLWYTNRDECYNAGRTLFNEEFIQRWFPQNPALSRTYLPGHVWGKPYFFTPWEDGEGVIAGTMNHVGPYPYARFHVKGSKITEIEGGGLFGDKLRKLMDQTKDQQYPGFSGKGLLHWWEASIGTNPKIHRPRAGFGRGWVCGVYERMRSGIVHIGFGTVVSSQPELEAVQLGLQGGHWHSHLNFATITGEMVDGSSETIIEDGHLKALDDPQIREIAAKYGEPNQLLSEDWIPAIPGINMEGDYFRDYASDPMDWTRTELHICEKWHHLFMKMVAPPA